MKSQRSNNISIGIDHMTAPYATIGSDLSVQYDSEGITR